MDSNVIILYRINNLCKKVSEILDNFLNKPKVSSSSSNGDNYLPKRYNPFYMRVYQDSNGGNYNSLKGIIRFFEWSDLHRAPVLFYRLEDFIVFLRRSKIDISETERSLILSIHNPYVTCEEGKPKLIIRTSSADLKLALDVCKKYPSNGANSPNGNGGYVIPSIRELGTAPQGSNANTPSKPYNGEYVGEWFENR